MLGVKRPTNSYGNMETWPQVQSLIPQTGGVEPMTPGLPGEWFTHCTTVAPRISSSNRIELFPPLGRLLLNMIAKI